MNNIWLTWGEVFNYSMQELWWGFIQFAPKLIIAILLFILGWVISSVVAKAFEQVCAALKIDKFLSKTGIVEILRRGDISLNTGYFLGQLMRWFILIIFILPSLTLVGLDSIAYFLKEDVLMFLPRVFIAAFILIVATIVADALYKIILAGTKSLKLSSANMLASVGKYTIWVFAILIALEQLGIASAYIQILFTGVIAMIAVAGALAFGLGGKDHASKMISKMCEKKDLGNN